LIRAAVWMPLTMPSCAGVWSSGHTGKLNILRSCQPKLPRQIFDVYQPGASWMIVAPLRPTGDIGASSN
jgi:hypothetical protein